MTNPIDNLERSVEHEANKPARLHTRNKTHETTNPPWKVVEKHTGNDKTLYYLCRFPDSLPAQTYGVYSRRQDAECECWLLNELGD